MDILTHAVVGAATGMLTGHPVIGAVVAVLPDITLGRKRREYPTETYLRLHSLTFIAVMFPSLWALFPLPIVQTCILAWLSHIVLDALTHSYEWAPRLYWPAEVHKGGPFGEWEWFNRSWWFGLFIAIIWVGVCLLLSFDTGFQSLPFAQSTVYRI